jgi:hypothetical protein
MTGRSFDERLRYQATTQAHSMMSASVADSETGSPPPMMMIMIQQPNTFSAWDSDMPLLVICVQMTLFAYFAPAPSWMASRLIPVNVKPPLGHTSSATSNGY